MSKLLTLNDKGLYCRPGDFYIDPWKKVKNALITHAHGDHARWGNRNYLAHHASVPIMKARLGDSGYYEGIEYGENLDINGVKVSFHPAGHIIGSAQIRLEYKGEIVVVSGDYKLENDGITLPFEPVKCHTFITESTFGLPVYKWPLQQEIFDDIHHWWRQNQEKGMTSVITAYSLGKAQRILANLDLSIGPVYVHGAIFNMNRAILESGLQMKEFPKIEPSAKKGAYSNAMIIAPPSSDNSPWLRRFYPYSIGVASGWMAIRGIKRRQAIDKGFVLSDHADWDGLNAAVEATGAENILATHGYTTTFSTWLREKGYNAGVLETQFEGELAEATELPAADETEGGQPE